MLERNKFELGDASLIRKMKKQQKRAHRAWKNKLGCGSLKTRVGEETDLIIFCLFICVCKYFKI